jgi:hypothetical protein
MANVLRSLQLRLTYAIGLGSAYSSWQRDREGVQPVHTTIFLKYYCSKHHSLNKLSDGTPYTVKKGF